MAPSLPYLYNDLLNCSPSTMLILFADDTNIFVSDRTYAETIDRANEVLGAVFKSIIYFKLRDIVIGTSCSNTKYGHKKGEN